MTDETLKKAQEIKNKQKVYNDILKKLSEQNIRLYSSTHRSDTYSEYIPEDTMHTSTVFGQNSLMRLNTMSQVKSL